MKALAHTFHDEDGAAEVEVLGPPNSTGLVRVRAWDGTIYARHAKRVEPINDEARRLLASSPAQEEVAYRHCA